MGGRLRARRGRYDLTRHAGSVLFQTDQPAEQQHRTVWCHRSLQNREGIAHVYRRADGSSARLSGVITCGNVWTCPVCCARIAHRRAEEVQRAMKVHVAEGGHVYLVTLTFPHGKDLALLEALKLFRKALQRWKGSSAYRRILGTLSKPGRYRRIGSIRSLEVTWGEANGWHPHTHDMVFAAPGLENDTKAIDELKSSWIDALLKVGLGDRSKLEWMWQRALDIRGGAAAADYITKFGRDAQWGLSSEITRSHAKLGMAAVTASEGHVSPFQILAWSQTGDGEAGELFRTYAEAMEGQRMLYWSPKLKARFGVDDVDDEAIAADESPALDEQRVATITAEDLSLLTSRRALGEMIEVVCLVTDPDPAHVQACIRDFLEELRARPPSARGTVTKPRRRPDGEGRGIYVFDTTRGYAE